ncbi:MAG: chemotaxis protein CheB, partial [Deltaproteobacteria bacterium]
LLALRRRGFLTIAQDKGTSVVYGMPRYASELGAAVKILPSVKIGSEIILKMTTSLQEQVRTPGMA